MREIKVRALLRGTNNWVFWTPKDNPLVLVDWKTLGEFTGLKDKNGKEIYEGDILKDSNEMGFVKWAYSAWTWTGTMELDPYSTQFEVIGNVWENPELLKK